MYFLTTIFFVGLYFVSGILSLRNNSLAPQSAQRTLGNAKNLTTTSFASFAPTLRALRPDYNQPEPILNSLISKISYTSAGGKAGNYESLDITQESLTYVQGHRGAEKTINEKTINSFWNKLTNAINLTDFDKIRSDPGHALYDGIDITISIEKGKEKHSIVNGNEDSLYYSKIKLFTDLLNGKLTELRKKIIW